MKLQIRYEAIYRYEAPASLSPHIVRVFPRTDLFVKIERVDFTTAPTGDVQFRRDLFDNLIAFCFYPELLGEMPFRLVLDVEVREKNPFHFLLESRAMRVPPRYSPEELAVLSAFVTPTGPLSLPEPLASGVSRPTVECLITLNSWIHGNLAYERREDGDPFEPAETLRRGAGSCRDFAVLLAEVLRHNGVAARLASGFVWEGDLPESDRRAESAMHAWVEAWLPGAGWIGMDPTNGVLCDHHFVTTAVGLRPPDISPVSGSYFGNQEIPHTLETQLAITKP